MKRCSKCETVKPFDDFPRDSRRKDGRYPQCRACRAAYHAQTAAHHSCVKADKYRANPTPAKNRANAHRVRNAEAIRASKAAAFAALPADARSARLVALRAWKKENRAKVLANTRARQARRVNATPAWANLAKVREFYESADALGMLTGEWFHVDHVVPLRGRTVCGLHNEFNLQVLPATENLKKNNRDWPGKP